MHKSILSEDEKIDSLLRMYFLHSEPLIFDAACLSIGLEYVTDPKYNWESKSLEEAMIKRDLLKPLNDKSLIITSEGRRIMQNYNGWLGKVSIDESKEWFKLIKNKNWILILFLAALLPEVVETSIKAFKGLEGPSTLIVLSIISLLIILTITRKQKEF